ncbi:MAG: phosphoribosylamine--glycine ligase [Caldiserica bacterium]|jgi:phosphoribosylamine--glycine ligase|nr:phosphoribosylamine--glycine ligase [Caldisericota bacterium]
MRALIYGNGGREHALLWKLAQSKHIERIFTVNPNPLMEPLGEALYPQDFKDLARLALKNGVSLAVVGPENPLASGLADVLEAEGIPTFGPHQEFTWLEASKVRAKEFNFFHSIPCARSLPVTTLIEAQGALAHFSPPFVIKADGLAGGKGVLIAQKKGEALKIVEEMLGGKFGRASRKLLIEEYLEGEELSLICLYDGKELIPLDYVRDYKKLMDHDRGPNTGGMGAISPVYLTEEMEKSISDLLSKLSQALKGERINYRGALYLGLMLTDEGAKVLEYNVRFGDPETQALMVRLEADLGEILLNVVKGRAEEIKLRWGEPANALVIASRGYPNSPQIGVEIGEFSSLVQELKITVFGGAISRQCGKLVSSGGRVLTAVATGSEARSRTLEFARRLEFEAKFYRTDIGGKA